MTTYIGKEAPRYGGVTNTQSPYGYLFGGWFIQSTGETTENEYTPIEKAEDVANETYVYAKFVPAYVMSVRAQNYAKARTESGAASQSASIYRVMSGVDSLNYKEVGYAVRRVETKDDGNNNYFYVGSYANSGRAVAKVYHALRVTINDTMTRYTPQMVMGSAASYFIVDYVQIANGKYDKATCIQPYWITMDGVQVDGLARYIHVEDGYVNTDATTQEQYRYVNIPVNLRKEEAPSVAGFLKMDYSSNSELECYKIEGGRFFQEMDWVVKSDKTINFVGNRKNIVVDHDVSDIYVNVRFRIPVVEGDVEDLLTGYDFPISQVEFGDKTETELGDYRVWNVKY